MLVWPTMSFLANEITSLRIYWSQMLSVSLLSRRQWGQASSKQCFTYGCHRRTASKFGVVIQSNDNQLPNHLWKPYALSESAKFTTAATQHYSHQRITWWESVLWLLLLWVLGNQMSLLGKRQDTVWTEIYEYFCLVASSPSDVTLQLNRKHSYNLTYWQCQIHVAKSAFCNFWLSSEVYIEALNPDSNFKKHVLKAAFFKDGVLPELLGKWFTWSAVLIIWSAGLFPRKENRIKETTVCNLKWEINPT